MRIRRSGESPSAAGRWQLVGWLVLALVGTGCESAMRMPGRLVRAVTPGSRPQTIDLAALQTELQRFADEYAERTTSALDASARNIGTPEARSQALRWKVSVNSAVITIVTGPNPQVNLLDTLALATLTRMALEEIGAKSANGPAFEPWLEVSRSLETYAWEELAPGVFSAEQLQELRDTLQRWWDTNPAGHLSFVARPVESRSLIRHTAETASRPGSVFALVGLDPTAGLDPAVRELTRTRLLAERAMFMAQRMPFVLRLQLELLVDQLLRDQNIAGLLTKTADLAVSAERISRAVESLSVTANDLPDRITAERRAVLEAIEAKESTLREVAGAFGQTLAAGERMSTSLNTSLLTFDALMQRFGVGEPAAPGPPADPAREPFRVLDYAETAARLEVASRELTVLLNTLDQVLGSTNLTELQTQVGAAVEQAQAGSRGVVDHAFWRALLLVGAILVAALLYRWIARRLAP